MGRSVSRESVEVRPGFSVDMTGQQRAFWSTLTSVPVGDQVSTEELCTKLDIEIRNLRVLKNKVGRLVSPAYIIKSKWGWFLQFGSGFGSGCGVYTDRCFGVGFGVVVFYESSGESYMSTSGVSSQKLPVVKVAGVVGRYSWWC